MKKIFLISTQSLHNDCEPANKFLRGKGIESITVTNFAPGTDGYCLYILSDKSKIPESLTGAPDWEESGMAVKVGDNSGYIRLRDMVYNRIEYEKFLSLAAVEGVEFGFGKYWLMLQLTFPMEFWSLNKRQRIAGNVRAQQLRFLLTKFLASAGLNDRS